MAMHNTGVELIAVTAPLSAGINKEITKRIPVIIKADTAIYETDLNILSTLIIFMQNKSVRAQKSAIVTNNARRISFL